MSPDARLMCGLTLILLPTIVYGGLTVLGIVTNRTMGAPGPNNLSPSQVAFYRAGHAHAGVLSILSLFLQIAIDYASIPPSVVWPARIGALSAAILVSGGLLCSSAPAPPARAPLSGRDRVRGGNSYRRNRTFALVIVAASTGNGRRPWTM